MPVTGGHEVKEFGPVQSTDEWMEFAEIDARVWNHMSISIHCENRAVDWKVFGANSGDYEDEVEVKESAKVNAGENDSFTGPSACFAYYRLAIKSDFPGSHGTVRVCCALKD